MCKKTRISKHKVQSPALWTISYLGPQSLCLPFPKPSVLFSPFPFGDDTERESSLTASRNLGLSRSISSQFPDKSFLTPIFVSAI
ncbi:hypothetical protein AAC387_Pa03g0540 [Persea americana]